MRLDFVFFGAVTCFTVSCAGLVCVEITRPFILGTVPCFDVFILPIVAILRHAAIRLIPLCVC